MPYVKIIFIVDIGCLIIVFFFIIDIRIVRVDNTKENSFYDYYFQDPKSNIT